MPVEYRLMKCFPKAFPVFPPFLFSSRCLYSSCVLLIVSSLALSTLPCVHLCPNKCALPLSMTLCKHSCFLCCSIPHFGVSTASPKKSSSFNMFSTSPIILIKYRNQYHMKNNIRYKDNANNTSEIIFFDWRTKASSGVTLLRRTSSEVFVMLVVIFVLHFVVVS